MKKQRLYSTVRFLTLLPTLSSGQQFLLVVFSLGLVSLLLWYFLPPLFFTEKRETSTASYEGLDPTSYSYWRERTERDIMSARELAKPSLPLDELLRSNLSATIRAVSQLEDPAEKALAISSIIHTQINHNVGTNIDEALITLGNSLSVRSFRMSLAGPLAFFYLPTNRSKATSIVQDYLTLFRGATFNTENVEQKNTLVQILDACAVLNLDRELESTLKSLSSAANSTVHENRKNLLWAFIAEQQIRHQKYADAFVTLSQITQVDLLVKGYQQLIESRAQVSFTFPRDSESEFVIPPLSSQGTWRPDLVAQTLERVFNNIGRIKDQEIQQATLNQLLESEMMVHAAIHDLVRNVLIETQSLPESLKIQSLLLVDNPRSEILRRARGMPPLVSENELDYESMTDEQIASQLLSSQPLSRNRMYQEDIRVLMNTATELLGWGQKQEAVLLLCRAAAKLKGLNLENRQGVSRTALAAILASAGEIETAQDILREESELLQYSEKNAQTDESYGRIAEIQLRARLLEETFYTSREMLPSPAKTTLLQSLVREQIRIGQFDEARKSIAEIPDYFVKTTLRLSLEETVQRLRKMSNENVYTYPPLEEILQSNGSEQHQRLFDLVAALVHDGLFVDAREVARYISDPDIRDQATILIVQEFMTVCRAYFSTLSLHQRVRNNMRSFGFPAAKEISSPQNRLIVMERVYSQVVGTLESNEVLPEWGEILTLWNSLSDTGDLDVKVDCGIRLFQGELRRHKSEVYGRIGGNWYVLPKDATFPSAEQKQILLTVAELVPRLASADDRAVRSAQLAALFYQIHDAENGVLQVEAAVRACAAVVQKDFAANVALSLAQTLHEAGEPEKAKEMFAKAVAEAESILTSNGGRGIDHLLDRRMRDRILTEISRGQVETGQITEAMQTASIIRESFFVDRLCKTIGYWQINQGAYEAAEATFKRIRTTGWRNSCLNDVLFRLRWDDRALSI